MSSNVNDKGTYPQKFIFLTYIKSEKINHLLFLWENYHGEYIPGELLLTLNRCLLMHWVKSVLTRRFSHPYFPAFGLNTKIYRVNIRFHPN